MKEECDIFNVPHISAPKKKKRHERDINKLALAFISDPTEANFEKLIGRVNWGLRSFMFEILKDNSAVDECMSRTMENIYYKRDTFDFSRGKFSTWMYKIAYHNCLKYKQGEFGYGSDSDTVSSDFSEIYESFIENEEVSTDSYMMDTDFMETFDMMYKNGEYVVCGKDQVVNDIYDASMRCMTNLPDNLRVVMQERYIKRKKVDDIAADNKIPVTSVKNWLRKGIAALNDELKAENPDLYDLYVNLKVEK